MLIVWPAHSLSCLDARSLGASRFFFCQEKKEIRSLGPLPLRQVSCGWKLLPPSSPGFFQMTSLRDLEVDRTLETLSAFS